MKHIFNEQKYLFYVEDLLELPFMETMLDSIGH